MIEFVQIPRGEESMFFYAEIFTAVGAIMAALAGVGYLKSKVQATFWEKFHSVWSTIFVGWVMPRPTLWLLATVGWIDHDTIPFVIPRVWCVLGFLWGLVGTCLVNVLIAWTTDSLPQILPRWLSRILTLSHVSSTRKPADQSDGHEQ